MRNTILVVVVVTLIGGGVFFLRGVDRDELQTVETQPYEDCRIDAECVLVQDGWCEIVLAVHKNKEIEWREENAKQVEIARQNQQTCEPMSADYLDTGDFKALCKQSRCVAELIVDN